MVEKLRALRTHLPDASDDLVSFAAYYADKLDPGFWGPDPIAMYWELCVTDIESGRDGFQSKPLNHPLVNRPRAVKLEIALSAPRVFMAVLPEEFARKVSVIFKAARHL